MTESELVAEVSRRTGLSAADIQAVLSVLADIRQQQRQAGSALPIETDALTPVPYTPSYAPGDEEVVRLIATATHHPLGLEFLLEGNLCAVATMFRVHAFTVDAARERIRATQARASPA